MNDYEVRLMSADGIMAFGPVTARGLCAAHAVEDLLCSGLIDYDTEAIAEVVLDSGVIMRFPFCKP